VWLLLGIAVEIGLVGAATMSPYLTALAVPTFLAAVMVTGYTGFLFGQAEGRDLWQSPLLFWHLIVQAVAVGAGAMLIGVPFADLGAGAVGLLAGALTLGAAVHVVMLLLEYLGNHETRQASTAAHLVTHGRYATTFWAGGVGLAAVAAVLGGVGWAGPLAVAVVGGVLVQAALLFYESVFVRAGQDVPLS